MDKKNNIERNGDLSPDIRKALHWAARVLNYLTARCPGKDRPNTGTKQKKRLFGVKKSFLKIARKPLEM